MGCKVDRRWAFGLTGLALVAIKLLVRSLSRRLSGARQAEAFTWPWSAPSPHRSGGACSRSALRFPDAFADWARERRGLSITHRDRPRLRRAHHPPARGNRSARRMAARAWPWSPFLHLARSSSNSCSARRALHFRLVRPCRDPAAARLMPVFWTVNLSVAVTRSCRSRGRRSRTAIGSRWPRRRCSRSTGPTYSRAGMLLRFGWFAADAFRLAFYWSGTSSMAGSGRSSYGRGMKLVPTTITARRRATGADRAQAHQGVEYERVPVNLLEGEQRGRGLPSRNPQGFVPTLESGRRAPHQASPSSTGSICASPNRPSFPPSAPTCSRWR